MGRDVSPSLSSWLAVAETRFSLLAQRPHQRPLLGTQAKQVPTPLTALASDPRACPSRSVSSLWDQPGHILAFDIQVSWRKAGFRAVVPASIPSPAPLHGLTGLPGFSLPTILSCSMGWPWTDEGLL